MDRYNNVRLLLSVSHQYPSGHERLRNNMRRSKSKFGIANIVQLVLIWPKSIVHKTSAVVEQLFNTQVHSIAISLLFYFLISAQEGENKLKNQSEHQATALSK